jgi:hypothetical protein
MPLEGFSFPLSLNIPKYGRITELIIEISTNNPAKKKVTK